MARLLADENIPERTIDILVERGWDILSIGIERASEKDPVVLQLAMDTDQLLVSHDRDFGALIFVQNMRPPRGVLYLRLGAAKPLAIADAVEYMLLDQSPDFDFAIIVYDGKKWRRRSYAIHL